MRPVVDPRTQTSKSPASQIRLGASVNWTAVGWSNALGPNSVGPLMSGRPRPSRLYDEPAGLFPPTISAISPSLTQYHPAGRGNSVFAAPNTSTIFCSRFTSTFEISLLEDRPAFRSGPPQTASRRVWNTIITFSCASRSFAARSGAGKRAARLMRRSSNRNLLFSDGDHRNPSRTGTYRASKLGNSRPFGGRWPVPVKA